MTQAPRPVTPLTILAADLQTIAAATQTLSDFPETLRATIQRATQLASCLEPYLTDCTTPESPALKALTERTQAEDWSQRFSDGETVRQLEQEMLSGHVEGQLLKLFVYMLQAKRVLEIGMFTGYSALAMAEALPEDGHLVACEVDAYVAQFAQQCFEGSPHGHKITVKVGPALETMRQLAATGDSFELVFIDADKKEYTDYFNLLLETTLLAPHGMICVDNTLLQGQPYLDAAERSANGDAIAQFNQRVAADPRVEQVLVPIRDGVTVIRRAS